MPKDGTKTRLRILDETKLLVLENGFAGTTIDQILERTGITKGAFFYHFKSKAALAKGLMEYFAKNDLDELEEVLRKTEHLKKYPRKRLLAFVQYFIDALGGQTEPHDGCLYASYINEPEQFSDDIKSIVTDALLKWRKVIVEIIEEVKAVTEVQMQFDADSLADIFSSIYSDFQDNRRRIYNGQGTK